MVRSGSGAGNAQQGGRSGSATRSTSWIPFIVLLTLSSGCVLDAQVDRAQGSFTRELSVTGPVELDLETGSGDVEVRTTATGSVRIDGRISASSSLFELDDARDRVREVEQAPPIEQSGNEIRIGQRQPRPRNIRISYRLNVPRNTSVRIRTGSGDIVADGLDGSVRVETGSGDLRLEGVGGDLRARTGSGDVSVEQVNGSASVRTGSGDLRLRTAGTRETELETGSGDVRVAGAGGALRVRTGSGGISVAGAPSAEWDLSTGSGDLSVYTPMTAAFRLHARSGSGEMELQDVTATERMSRREVRGTVRGDGPLVSMTTGSGEIRVR